MIFMPMSKENKFQVFFYLCKHSERHSAIYKYATVKHNCVAL